MDKLVNNSWWLPCISSKIICKSSWAFHLLVLSGTLHHMFTWMATFFQSLLQQRLRSSHFFLSTSEIYLNNCYPFFLLYFFMPFITNWHALHFIVYLIISYLHHLEYIKNFMTIKYNRIEKGRINIGHVLNQGYK